MTIFSFSCVRLYSFSTNKNMHIYGKIIDKKSWKKYFFKKGYVFHTTFLNDFDFCLKTRCKTHIFDGYPNVYLGTSYNFEEVISPCPKKS